VQAAARKSSDDLFKANGVGFIRHLVSGDMMKTGSDGRKIVDRDYCRSLFKWHREKTQRFTVGWTYTHFAKQVQKAGFGPDQHPEGLHILASCHSLEEAADLQSNGWRTARVTEDPKDKVAGEALCPYDLNKHNGVDNKEAGVNCMTCRLCFQSNVNIVFLKF